MHEDLKMFLQLVAGLTCVGVILAITYTACVVVLKCYGVPL